MLLDLADGDGVPRTGRVDLADQPCASQLLVEHCASSSFVLEQLLTSAVARCVPVGIQRRARRHWATVFDPPELILRIAEWMQPAAAGQEMSYGPSAHHRLDVYESSGRRKDVPVIIFVHGGAWSSGSKRVYRLVGQRIAEAGFTCCVLGYRLMKPGEEATMRM